MSIFNQILGFGAAPPVECFSCDDTAMNFGGLRRGLHEYPFEPRETYRYLPAYNGKIQLQVQLWLAELQHLGQLPNLNGMYLVIGMHNPTSGPETLLFPAFPADIHRPRFVDDNGGVIVSRFGVPIFRNRDAISPDLLNVAPRLAKVGVIDEATNLKSFKVQGDPTEREYVPLIIPGFSVN